MGNGILFDGVVRLIGSDNQLFEAHRAILRASHKACLPFSLPEQLRLLDWTGRQIRGDKRGAIPASLGLILERLVFC